eukprot:1115471-Prymnesium_polylepis.1
MTWSTNIRTSQGMRAEGGRGRREWMMSGAGWARRQIRATARTRATSTATGTRGARPTRLEGGDMDVEGSV